MKHDTLEYLMHAPCCEPVKRMHGEYKHHCHRFAIRGGISRMKLWSADIAANITRSNPLLRKLMERSR